MLFAHTPPAVGFLLTSSLSLPTTVKKRHVMMVTVNCECSFVSGDPGLTSTLQDTDTQRPLEGHRGGMDIFSVPVFQIDTNIDCLCAYCSQKTAWRSTVNIMYTILSVSCLF